MTGPRRRPPAARALPRCSRCRYPRPAVRRDPATGQRACDPCWFATRPESEPRPDP